MHDFNELFCCKRSVQKQRLPVSANVDISIWDSGMCYLDISLNIVLFNRKLIFTFLLSKSLMEELFQSSIDLYVRVGAKEVLKDFKRCYSLKKTMAHRHMVLMRTQKKERKKSKLEMEEFKKDRSPNKSVSHAKLKGMVLQFGDAFLWTVYKVPEIRRLCAASDVPIPTAVKKKVDIAKLVIPVIKQTNQFKCSYFLDELRAEQHDEQRPEGPIRIRIRRDIP